jgi:hypothetical protein
VARDLSADLNLTPLNAPGRPVREWLTNFHLLLVSLDPYTNESAWILDTAARVMRHYADTDARMCWHVTANADGARDFLGPLAKEFLTFTDPDRTVVRGLGLTTLPAISFVRADGQILAGAEGWDPRAWRAVIEAMAPVLAWSTLDLPQPKDPRPFAGTPA